MELAYHDCAKHGFVPGAGNYPQFSTTANIWPGFFSKQWKRSKQEEREEQADNCTILTFIIIEASELRLSMIQMLSFMTSIIWQNVGDVNTLPFYHSVAVAIRLLKSDTAKRNSFQPCSNEGDRHSW